jgi:hypothetical protein
LTGKWTIERRQFVEERAWECLKACEYVTGAKKRIVVWDGVVW